MRLNSLVTTILALLALSLFAGAGYFWMMANKDFQLSFLGQNDQQFVSYYFDPDQLTFSVVDNDLVISPLADNSRKVELEINQAVQTEIGRWISLDNSSIVPPIDCKYLRIDISYRPADNVFDLNDQLGNFSCEVSPI